MFYMHIFFVSSEITAIHILYKKKHTNKAISRTIYFYAAATNAAAAATVKFFFSIEKKPNHKQFGFGFSSVAYLQTLCYESTVCTD